MKVSLAEPVDSLGNSSGRHVKLKGLSENRTCGLFENDLRLAGNALHADTQFKRPYVLIIGFRVEKINSFSFHTAGNISSGAVTLMTEVNIRTCTYRLMEGIRVVPQVTAWPHH